MIKILKTILGPIENEIDQDSRMVLISTEGITLIFSNLIPIHKILLVLKLDIVVSYFLQEFLYLRSLP